MLPSPTCGTCAEGQILQAAGAWPPGIPFCPRHEWTDEDDGVTETRRSIGGILVRRWQLRTSERLVGWAAPLVLLVLFVAALLRFAVTHPRTTLTVIGCFVTVAAVRAYGSDRFVVGSFAVVAALFVWAWCWPASFDRHVEWPARAWWRRWMVYRRQWDAVMIAGELDRKGELPTLRRVRCTADADVVTVRAPLGQKPGVWAEAAPFLAHAFRAEACIVSRGSDRGPVLTFRRPPGA